MTESRFFDIDHILMEAEKVQAELLTDSYNCDNLEQGRLSLEPVIPESVLEEIRQAMSQSQEPAGSQEKSRPKTPVRTENPLDEMPELTTLPRGTKLKLPIWLAFSFLNQRYVAIQLQEVFEAEYIKASLPHPEGLNLKEKCNYYYEVGMLLSQRLSKPTIATSLGKIYLERLKHIFKILFHESDSTISNNFLQKLSSAEEQFYDQSKRAFEQFKIWHSGKHLEALQYNSHINRMKIRNDKGN